MNTYTIERTRSGHFLLVKWPQEGSSSALAYPLDRINRAILEVEEEGYEPKGSNAVYQSVLAHSQSLF